MSEITIDEKRAGDTSQMDSILATFQKDAEKIREKDDLEMKTWMEALLKPKVAATNDGYVTLSVAALQEILDAAVLVDNKMRILSRKISVGCRTRRPLETGDHERIMRTTSDSVNVMMDILHKNIPIKEVPLSPPGRYEAAYLTADMLPCRPQVHNDCGVALLAALSPLDCMNGPQMIVHAPSPVPGPVPGPEQTEDEEDLYA
jgi:hypothetical protein